MTASDSSLSAIARSERLTVDLIDAGLLPPLARAFARGDARDLLAPLDLAEGNTFQPVPVDRRALADALGTANTSYGHRRASELARKLADPSTLVVVTGQQPGLFGGPLYTLSKAVAATLWAERLEANGQSATAVFWISTEDHDYREIAESRFPTVSGIVSVDLGDDASPLLPVGMRTLGEQVSRAFGRIAEGNPGDRYARWLERVAGWYRPEARFGEAFARFLADLLGDRCPLLLDAMLPAVKAAQRPWLESMVHERDAVEEAFVERDRAIEARGFPLQVAPQRGASPLFVLRGHQRRRVEWQGASRFRLRGSEPFEESVDWLLEMVAENPAAVSAGVMGRSALQDAILGTTVLLLGPGEASYIPQVAPIYEVLGIKPPAVALRPQAMVLTRHQIEHLESLDVTLAEIVAPSFEIDAFLAGSRSDDTVSPASDAILSELEKLKTRALAIDPNLEGPWRKTRQQIEKSLAAFSGRVTASLGRRDTIARSRLESLREAVVPGGALQERVVSTAHFPGKFGDALAEAFFAQLGLDPRRLHLIVPGESS